MKNKAIKFFFAFSSIFMLGFVAFSPSIFAQEGVCDFLPCEEYGEEDVRNVNTTLENGATYVLSLVFVGIVILGVYQIIKAALKIIRSQGKAEELEGGINIMRGVWVGIGLFFVGLIGLILVLAVLDSGGIISTVIGKPSGLEKVDLPFIDNE